MQNHLEHNQLETEIWQQLLRASVDKHHEWRSPILVTNGLVTNGLVTNNLKNDDNHLLENTFPEARTVILRGVNVDNKQLTFYTDSRSPKVAQIVANPQCTLVFWSKRLSQQLRVKVNIQVDVDSDLNKITWQKVKQSPSAGDYLSSQTPGEIFENSSEKSLIINNKTNYFALLMAKVVSIDWLALNRDGHKRAKIDANGITYLIP